MIKSQRSPDVRGMGLRKRRGGPMGPNLKRNADLEDSQENISSDPRRTSQWKLEMWVRRSVPAAAVLRSSVHICGGVYIPKRTKVPGWSSDKRENMSAILSEDRPRAKASCLGWCSSNWNKFSFPCFSSQRLPSLLAYCKYNKLCKGALLFFVTPLYLLAG